MSFSRDGKRPSVTTTLLLQYYDRVVDLLTHLTSISDLSTLCDDSDEDTYRAFLHGTMIATNCPEGSMQRFVAREAAHEMKDVVEQAQRALLKRAGDNSKNVLALGCRLAHVRKHRQLGAPPL